MCRSEPNPCFHPSMGPHGACGVWSQGGGKGDRVEGVVGQHVLDLHNPEINASQKNLASGPQIAAMDAHVLGMSCNTIVL